MHDVEKIRELFSQLVSGWPEHIEYAERITVHSQICRAARIPAGACPCPHVIEKRARTIRHAPLVAQLQTAASQTLAAGSGDGGRPAPNKPGSRPPVHLAPLALLDDITAEVHYWHDVLRMECGYEVSAIHSGRVASVLMNMLPLVEKLAHERPSVVAQVHDAARKWVRDARLLLGHDQKQALLPDTVCGECGGGLIVAKDASTSVRCIGAADSGGCGTEYTRARWLELAAESGGGGA